MTTLLTPPDVMANQAWHAVRERLLGWCARAISDK